MRPARVGLLSLFFVSISCSESTAPVLPYVGYELLEVDGTPLPTEADLPEGYLLVRRELVFTPSPDQGVPDEEEGEVRITSHTLPPGGSLQHRVTLHRYWIGDGMISIDLCPIDAVCPAVITSLSGPVGPNELILQQSMGGQVQHTFRYRPVLPE